MTEGAAYLATLFYGLMAAGRWRDERGVNVLDSGAPYYDTYATKDGKFVAVGAIEPKFYAALIAGLGLADEGLPAQDDRVAWPQLRMRFAELFRTRTRDEWAAHFAATDACVTPVLSLTEAARHPHAVARRAFRTEEGILRPAPAPRLGDRVEPPPPASPRATLADWGLGEDEVRSFVDAGALPGATMDRV